MFEYVVCFDALRDVPPTLSKIKVGLAVTKA